LAAKLVVIDDPCELRDTSLEPGFLVLAEKEACVSEARTNNSLVSAHDPSRILDLHVGHDQKFRDQLSVTSE
jgi:hypothetical protein